MFRHLAGGISLKSLIAVATVMAEAADYDTGRNSRLTVETIAERIKGGERTVQRARQALKLLRVATEVLRGRLRTKDERYASWRFNDKARGWASVWALHPSKPVDKTRITVAGSIQMAPPHPHSGHFKSFTSRREVLNTKRSVDKRAASRRKESKAGGREGRRRPERLVARIQMAQQSTNSRLGAAAHPPRGWAPALTEPAAHGWTAADLNDAIDAWSKATRMAPDPKHPPIAFIRWLMKQQDLAFAPHVLAQIAADQEKAERERQAAAFEAERGRYASAAAEDSPPAAKLPVSSPAERPTAPASERPRHPRVRMKPRPCGSPISQIGG